jgi:hypothetical protein
MPAGYAMTDKLRAAITSDVDTLASIYKGEGCRRAGGYTYLEFRVGLENFSEFLRPYGARATLFMVGNDFKIEKNHASIRDVAADGHEIANHTTSHAQGFRHLSPEEKKQEIMDMDELCRAVAGVKPIGFRSPGWNISDDAIPVLQEAGYHYDSSVFPTSLSPALKLMHWYTSRSRGSMERSTLGQSEYVFAPIVPYRTRSDSFLRRGNDGILEFPVTVTPLLRIPFFATFLLSSGFGVFKQSYLALKNAGRPVQFQFHLSDFVDYGHPELLDQVPEDGKGYYVPKALRMPLAERLAIFRRVMDTLAEDYCFSTLSEWVGEVRV